MAERRQGSVTYREAGAEYFDQRKLRRHAGVWSLWALGVGAVISGDFFGWNFGLAYGFGGLLVATLVITFASLAILTVFFVGAIGEFSFDEYAIGDQGWFPDGVPGVFYALPFAIWFYLAIEELPLASEESHDPKRDIPRGTIYGLITLVFTGFGILFLNAGIAPGSEALSESGEPLNDGLKTIFGEGTATSVLALIAVTGLVASFHTIIYAYGRNIFSLSRAGYYPHFLSLTHGRRSTPHVALLAGAVVGFGLTLLLDQAQTHEWLGGNLGAALLTMAVFGAVISYFMQTLAFILLRRRLPEIERPYRSPLGEWGAFIASVIALVSLISLFWNDDYRPGVVGVAIFYAVALAYFAIAGRHRLVLSPEEEFSVTPGLHRHPGLQGHGVPQRQELRPR